MSVVSSSGLQPSSGLRWSERLGRFALACVVAGSLLACEDPSESDDDEGVTSTTPAVDGGADGSVPNPLGIDSGGDRGQSTGLTGKLLYQASEGETFELDLATGVPRVLMTGGGFEDVSASGSELLFSRFRDRPWPEEDGYELVTTDRNGVVSWGLFPFESLMNDARFGADDRMLAALIGPPPAVLFMYTRADRRSSSLNDVSGFAFLPDNRMLLTNGDGIFVRDTSTGAIKGVIQITNGFPTHLAPSPDGTRIALEIGNSDRFQNQVWIFDLTAEGTAKNLRQLTDAALGVSYPTWSPDSRYLAVIEGGGGVGANFVDEPGRSGCPTLYVVPADATSTIRVGLDGTAQPVRIREKDGTVRNGACVAGKVRWVAR